MSKQCKNGNSGIRLGDFLPDQPASDEAGKTEESGQAKESTKNRLSTKINDLKARATKENVPWSEYLEAKLRECPSKGAIKRLWKRHRMGQPIKNGD